jgi:hypothetical protein
MTIRERPWQMVFQGRACCAGEGGVVPAWNRPPHPRNLEPERWIEMKRILLAVALLLLASTATNAAPPGQSKDAAPARYARPKGVKTVQPSQQRATAQAPTQAAQKALPANAQATRLTQVATKGQTGQPAPVGATGFAPRSFAVSDPSGPVTVNPNGTTTVDLSQN